MVLAGIKVIDTRMVHDAIEPGLELIPQGKLRAILEEFARLSILAAPGPSSFARNPIARYEFVASPSLGD